MRETITPVLLRELLIYEADTGRFYWKRRELAWFPNKRLQAVWNSRFAGQAAGYTKTQNGYLKIGVLRRQFLTHRVAWAIVHNEWPEHEIDHINGNRADNRMENLRSVTAQVNRRNAARRANRDMHVGVTFCKRLKKWIARITVSNVTYHIGVFATVEEAVTARKDWEYKLGFHPNHGRVSMRAA